MSDNKLSYTGTCPHCGGDMYSYYTEGDFMTACENCGYHRDIDDSDYEPRDIYDDPWNRCEPDLSDIKIHWDENL